VVRARGEAPRDVRFLRRRRQHHDLRGGESRIAAQPRADLEPAHIRQVDVEEDQLGAHRFGVGESGLAVEGVDHGDALVLERQADEIDHVRLVVGDQDRQHDDRSGQARCQRRPLAATRSFYARASRSPCAAGGAPTGLGNRCAAGVWPWWATSSPRRSALCFAGS